MTIKLPDGNAAPTEFLIWRAGTNTTANGYDVTFDEAAARSVMAEYEKHGVEVAIDLEHLSLDDAAPNYDPDARGWARLELRNGDLWAVNVRWTPDGARRLQEQTQRYMSPAFVLDEENRPTRIFNIALVAMPGTDNARPLAAKRGARPGAKRLAMAESSADKMGAVAQALGITVDPATDPAGFVSALSEALSSILAELKGGAEEPKPEDAAPGSEMAAAPEMAAAKALFKVLGAKDATEALLTVADWRKLAIEHAEAKKRLADEQKALDDTKRRQLTARLVVCGAELPATAWADDAKTQPAEHLAKMSLAALEARCLAFEAKGGAKPLTPAGAPEAHGLSERELAMCSQMKIDPKDYAANKARVAALRAGKD